MLTDDDLIRELESGFREESAGLRYTGRVPTPRRGAGVPWSAVPIAAAAAAVLVLPQLGGTGAQTATPRPPAATSPATPDGSTATGAGTGSPSTDAEPALVTDTIELAGFAFRYQHAPGTPVPEVYLALGSPPPSDATPVDGLDTAAAAWVTKAWVGTDPVSGDAALWVQSPGEGVGAHVMFWSPDLTTDDLARMLRDGSTAEDAG